MQRKTLTGCAIIAVMALANCGGGGGGGGGGASSGPQAPPASVSGTLYRPLSDTANPGSSTVQLASITQTGGLPSSTTAANGTLDRQSQVLNVPGVIANGSSTGASWEAGATRVTRTTAGGLTGSYDFFTPVTVTTDGGATENLGVLGVRTNPVDMPTSRTATYTGEANVTQIITAGAGGVSSSAGNVSIDADFAAGRATVEMDNLSGLAFDTVTIQDARIIDGGIDEVGSTVDFSLSGAPVAPIGAQSGHSVDGSFYGLRQSDGLPEEAAGVFAVTGADGNVSGIFAGGSR